MEIPASAALATKGLTPAQTETFLFRVRLEQINQKLLNPAKFLETENLGPDPAPIYNADGQRVNTREKRFRDKLIEERQKLLEKALSANPALRALAPGFQPAKKVARINIPVEKYPGYNFIGLIIGPRGNTQKRMEKETGCKISIRGKGSSKKGRPQPDDDQPLHVHIIAPDEQKLAAAEKMINKLLVPMDEEQNIHKAKQLRELALINGTLRDIPKCRICGEDGHKIQDCPKRQASWTPANIRCKYCGLDTHPSIDCPNKGTVGGNATQLNDEYASFMAELTGGEAPKPAQKPASRSAPTSGGPPGLAPSRGGPMPGRGGPPPHGRGGPPPGRGHPGAGRGGMPPYGRGGPPPPMYGRGGYAPPPMYPPYGGYAPAPGYGYGYPPAPMYGAPPPGLASGSYGAPPPGSYNPYGGYGRGGAAPGRGAGGYPMPPAGAGPGPTPAPPS